MVMLYNFISRESLARTISLVIVMEKKDILRWSKRYDKDHAWLAQKEKELGAKFRKAKVFTRDDLYQIVDWRFKETEEKRDKVLSLVAENEDSAITRVSSQVFSVPVGQDAFRMDSLTSLHGFNPVLASVILTFYDPKNYGIFEVHAWRALLGREPPNLYTTGNYPKLLGALRRTANKHNLEVRTVEKALFQKEVD
jgi:hypothetical protein